MAYTNLSDLFKAICNSIRAKKGTTGKINHQDIPNEIDSIVTGDTIIVDNDNNSFEPTSEGDVLYPDTEKVFTSFEVKPIPNQKAGGTYTLNPGETLAGRTGRVYSAGTYLTSDLNVSAAENSGSSSIYARVDKTIADTSTYGLYRLPIRAVSGSDVSELPIPTAISVVKTTELYNAISAFYINVNGVWGGAVMRYNGNSDSMEAYQIDDYSVAFYDAEETGEYVLCVHTDVPAPFDEGTYHVIVHYE